MPRPDPQPPDERDTAWLLQSGMAWALTGAVMAVEHRPLWDAVGVVLLVLGFGVVGWVVRGLLRPATAPSADPRRVRGWTGGPRLGRRVSRHRGAWAGRAGSGGRRRPAA